MSNYPDDIRMYDDDPRSPFYKGPEGVNCTECGDYTDWNDMGEGELCLKCEEYLKEEDDDSSM